MFLCFIYLFISLESLIPNSFLHFIVEPIWSYTLKVFIKLEGVSKARDNQIQFPPTDKI